MPAEVDVVATLKRHPRMAAAAAGLAIVGVIGASAVARAGSNEMSDNLAEMCAAFDRASASDARLMDSAYIATGEYSDPAGNDRRSRSWELLASEYPSTGLTGTEWAVATSFKVVGRSYASLASAERRDSSSQITYELQSLKRSFEAVADYCNP